MARSNNDNHKAGKQRDTRKEKQASKETKTAAITTTTNSNKVKTHYHSPHAY